MLRSYGFTKTGISHLSLVGFSFSRQITEIEDEEMKYSQTISLSPGVVTDVITTITTEIYNVFILDSDGNDISDALQSITFEGGFYVLHIYSAENLGGVKLLIIY